MAVREIAARFEIVCDGCAKTVEQNSKNRPEYWSKLILQRDAYDFQGSACADATVERLLCANCTTKIAGAINAALEKAGVR